jgi:hypothetical protein
VRGDLAFGQQRGQRRRHLAASPGAQADEDDVRAGARRAIHRPESLAREAVREDRQEVRHLGLTGELGEGVLHQLVDAVALEALAELADEPVDHLVDVAPGDGVDSRRHVVELARAVVSMR